MKERTKTLLILVVLLICSFLPVFAASPFSQQDSSLVIKEVLMKTSVAYLWLSPMVHVVTVVLLVALYLYGPRVGRVTDVFFAVLILFIAFSNHIAVTDTYGLAIVTGNLVPILIVGLFWFEKSINLRTAMFSRGFRRGDTGFCPLLSWPSGLQ